MTCEPISLGAGVTATICRPAPMVEVVRDSRGEHWCFRCRARREFFFVLRREEGLTYYGPHPSIRCSSDHLDGDLFPGRVREWEG